MRKPTADKYLTAELALSARLSIDVDRPAIVASGTRSSGVREPGLSRGNSRSHSQ